MAVWTRLFPALVLASESEALPTEQENEVSASLRASHSAPAQDDKDRRCAFARSGSGWSGTDLSLEPRRACASTVLQTIVPRGPVQSCIRKGELCFLTALALSSPGAFCVTAAHASRPALAPDDGFVGTRHNPRARSAARRRSLCLTTTKALPCRPVVACCGAVNGDRDCWMVECFFQRVMGIHE